MGSKSHFHSLCCIIEQDEDSGVYVGHCLNYDLMDSAPTQDGAWANLKIVVKNHIEYCYTYNQVGLNREVSKETWDRFFKLFQESPGSVKVDKIEVALKPPSLPAQELGIWVQRIERGGQVADIPASKESVPVN